MLKLENLGMVEFPNAICSALDHTCWHAWVSPKESAAKRQERRLQYAKWLQDKTLGKKGVYIWTQEIEPNLLRFIHVGISQKGKSTLATRTQCHLRRQLSLSDATRDRIHRLDLAGADEFGTLGRDLRSCAKWETAAEKFIENLRILYLIPITDRPLEAIRNLEGVLAYAASYLLDTDVSDRNGQGDWETTNTLNKTTKWEADLDKAVLVSNWLNGLSRWKVLPSRPRRKQ